MDLVICSSLYIDPFFASFPSKSNELGWVPLHKNIEPCSIGAPHPTATSPAIILIWWLCSMGSSENVTQYHVETSSTSLFNKIKY